MIIHDTVEQGTLEWMKLRCGKVTASEFDNFMTIDGELRRAKGSKVQLSEGAHTYLCRKAGEIVRGQVEVSKGSWSTEQGNFREESAIPWFEIERDCEVTTVGFVEADCGQYGCSPDGLIGDDSGLEVKCPEPTAHVRYLLAGMLPKEYALQVYGSMLVTGRNSWNFLSYHRDLPKLIVTVEKDEALLLRMASSIAEFTELLSSAVDTIRDLKTK